MKMRSWEDWKVGGETGRTEDGKLGRLEVRWREGGQIGRIEDK